MDGKPLKGLKVDKVAGASWTSDAFNKALEVAPPGGFDSGVRPLLQQCWPQQIGHARGQAVSSSIALPSMASYATKDPIIVDNSNFSSTSSRNTPCATPCLRNAPHAPATGHHLVDDVLEELGLAGQYNAHALDVDVVVAHPIDQSLQ